MDKKCKGVIIMKIKKIVSIILAGIMACATLMGCTNSSEGNVKKTEQALKETSIEVNDNNTENEENTSNVLVVYFSASGNTENVAKTIAEETGGDLFELVPVEVYTSDDLNYNDNNSRVTKEHENPDLRDVGLVANTVGNWDSYDTIFIGYPIWWGIAAWPVNSFVQLNDFTGKTVIPFATSASSGMGESGELLKEQAATGAWQEGKRFKSGASADEIKSWIQELALKK